MPDARLTEPWMRRRRRAMRLGTRLTILFSRLTGGRFISKMAPRGAPPVFLLTTTGRRSGQPRTVPLSLLRDDAGHAITTGTHGGLPTEPAWVLNLRADPAAVMEIDGDSTPVVAEFVEGDEWSELWDRIRTEYPIYEDPLSTANRDVPLIRLVPVGP
jgi:deazaflavin-dependent oxidoreductase (nitroreductase family)